MNIFESVGRAMISEAHDGFSLEVDDEWVHILDGEGSVRVSMPTDTWDNLVKKYIGRK